MRAERSTNRGFTVMEALVTVSVFSLFFGVLLATISHGFRTYSVALARSDVAIEARRLVLFFEKELRGSSYFSVVTEKRTLNTGLSRDGICFVTLSDWSREDAYNNYETRPDWDRYTVYYATEDPTAGKLIRLVIDPGTPGLRPYPYVPFLAFPDDYLLEEPIGATPNDVKNVRLLATKVKSFKVTLDPLQQEVRVHTLLRQNGLMSRRTDGLREGGTFELNYIIQPQNSR